MRSETNSKLEAVGANLWALCSWGDHSWACKGVLRQLHAHAQERKMADLSVLAFTLVVGAIHRRLLWGLAGLCLNVAM